MSKKEFGPVSNSQDVKKMVESNYAKERISEEYQPINGNKHLVLIIEDVNFGIAQKGDMTS